MKLAAALSASAFLHSGREVYLADVQAIAKEPEWGDSRVSAMKFDEDLSRKIEALYLTPDVVAQRVQVLQALELTAGQQVLDIGLGPGKSESVAERDAPSYRDYQPRTRTLRRIDIIGHRLVNAD